MVTLKVVKSFFDKEKNVSRQIGEIIEVGDKRANELLSHPLGLVEVVEPVVANTENIPPKRKKKVD
jgi:hypothetical protein